MINSSLRSRTRKKFEQLIAEESELQSPDGNIDKLDLLKNEESSPKGSENRAFENDQLSPQHKLPPLKTKRRRKQPTFAESSFSVEVQKTAKPNLDDTKNSPQAETHNIVKPSSEPSDVIGDNSSSSQITEHPIENPDFLNANNSLILGVNIHETDRLQNNFFIFHPMVKVHLLDEQTGAYLKKSDVICLPKWEELLVFNESFDYIIQQKSAIFFFEILDFVSPSNPLFNVKEIKERGGWHYVAWAFFKPVGANGAQNTGKRVRLQLYKPLEQDNRKRKGIPVYQWWQRNKRTKYPSTLYVTVKAVQPIQEIAPSMRSMLPIQPEETYKTLPMEENSSNISSPKENNESSIQLKPSELSRLSGQFCKIPSSHLLDLSLSSKGCFCVKFSHSGSFLACGCSSEAGSFVIINETFSTEKFAKFEGHEGIIYDLDWSLDDKLLLSASADATVRVWSPVNSRTRKSCLTLLPHPSFVYAAKFLHLDKNNSIGVVTGCFDSIIRMWQLDFCDVNQLVKMDCNLLQELGDHAGPVNCFCLATENSVLVSGDSLGQILFWDFSDSQRSKDILKKINVVSLKELEGSSINSLHLFSSDRKLIVNSRMKSILIVDVHSSLVLYHLEREHNSLRFARGCISPCATLYFAPGDRGNVYVWNIITNDLAKVFRDLPYKQSVSCIDYHPHHHAVAFCSTEDHSVISIYKHKFTESQTELSEKCSILSDPMSQASSSHQETESNDFKEDSTRLRAVVQKLDSVMKAVSYFKAKRSDKVQSKFSATQSLSNLVEPEVSKDPDLEDSEIQNTVESPEKFTAVLNALGELEIIPSIKPVPKARKKRRERLETKNSNT